MLGMALFRWPVTLWPEGWPALAVCCYPCFDLNDESNRKGREMTEAEEREVREIVRSELLGIVEDAQTQLSTVRDPTGIGRRVLEGLANLIRRRAGADYGDRLN
jgi:hypothetical protein